MTAAKKTATVKKVAAKAVPPRKRMVKPAIAQKTGKTGAPQPLKAQPRSSVATPATQPPVKRQRTDWDAVERDYRTGKFTLRELAAKYGVSHQAIAKQAKANGWTQDLSIAIKQATNAKLVDDLVAKEVARSGQAVANTILAAADLNKQVILGHRDDIRRARALTNFLLDELEQISIAPTKLNKLVEVLGAGQEFTASETLEARQAVSDLVKLPNRILSAQRIAQVMARLQPLERKAFGLDDDIAPAAVDAFDELSDEELDRRIDEGYERHRPR